MVGSADGKSGGLRLVKGHHVEVVEWPSSVEGASNNTTSNSSEPQCRVRVVLPVDNSVNNSNSGNNSANNEVLIPMSVIRQFMSLRLSNSRNSFSNDGSQTVAMAAASAVAAADGSPAAGLSLADSPSAVTGTPTGASQRKTSFK